MSFSIAAEPAIAGISAAGSLADRTHLGAVVDEIAHRTPDRPFLILRKSDTVVARSYRDLATRARAFAGAYRARGLRPGDTIALMLVTHPDLPAAFIGAMHAGLVPTLFPAINVKQDPAVFWPAQRGAFDRLEVGLVVVEAEGCATIATHLPEHAHRIMDIDAPLPDADDDPPVTAPGGIAFLQHSSGTTGIKKGVILKHRAVLDFAASLAAAMDLRDDDIVASWLPVYHDMGLVGALIVPMLLGLTIVQLDPFEWVLRPNLLLEAIEIHRATRCWLPNFAFHHLMRAQRGDTIRDLSSIRTIIDAAEPCKPDTLRRFRATFASSGLDPLAVQVAYGMAENVLIATMTDRSREPRTLVADRRAFLERQRIEAPAVEPAAEGGRTPDGDRGDTIEFVSVGRSIEGTRLRIQDVAGLELPDREIGEIAIASSYLFDGYYRRETDPRTLVSGWYRTGDFGFVDEGELFCCGRIDDLLIVNGKNLYAHDIEFAANAVDGVKPGRIVAIAPFSPRSGSQALVVIVETELAGTEERAALRRAVIFRINDAFGVAPYDVLVTDVGWLVKTTSGKIGRGINETRYVEAFPRILGG